VIPHCIAFQLDIQIFGITIENYKNWSCSDDDFMVLPGTMNTIDKMGIAGVDPMLNGSAKFHSKRLLAPDSRPVSKEAPEAALANAQASFDVMTIYPDTDSLIRATVVAEAGVKIELVKGETVLAWNGSKTPRTPPIYWISYKVS
jgi:hypothetical protein